MNPIHNKTNKQHYQIEVAQITLKPFLKEYIGKYYSWLQNQQLLTLTGTDPLSLQELQEAQKQWIASPHKYIFIIFYKQTMVGDVNLFFSQWIQPHQSEVNIMIAESNFRGKGIGKQVLRVAEQFAQAHYKRGHIIAKIKKGNQPSIKLFQSAGYKQLSFNQHFQEHQFHKAPSPITWQQFTTKYKVTEVQIS